MNRAARTSEDFGSIAREHLVRYPLMEPQDLGKLAFQSEFGPGHLVSDRASALAWLSREWEDARGEKPAASATPLAEPIGGGLCRLHLDVELEPDLAAPLVCDLFCRTAAERWGTGTRESLMRRLDAVSELGVPGMAAWRGRYEGKGCPAVHHSEAFRAAYRPHYRVVSLAYGALFPALVLAARLSRLGHPAVMAIDGRCASGKTTLAALLHELFGCNVFHADDFYLPVRKRAERWREVPAGNMDLVRLRDEVVLPAREGRTVRTHAFDCQTGAAQPIEVPASQLTVVEGSYSEAPLLSGLYDGTVFLTCSEGVQRERLAAREGEGLASYLDTWVPLEERYHKACDVAARADLVLDTSLL